MGRPPQLLSSQGEKVILGGMAIGLMSLLLVGFACLRAPFTTLLVLMPLILLCLGAVRKDLLHVRRYGWSNGSGSDGSTGEGGHGEGDGPTPSDPPGGGEPLDWDTFVTEFWEHVERQPVA